MKRRILGRRVASLATLAALSALGALVAPPAAHAQAPSLLDVLARATEYVDDLHDRLVGVVMEERYEQRARYPPGAGFAASAARVTLRSDYLLLEPEGSDRPFGFRDVFEANGRPVRDREERLTRLFLNPTASVRRRIQGILAESARHNIGDVERTTNTPTLALLFLGSAHKSRFAFERASDTSPELGVDEPEGQGDVWAVAYRETWPVTLVRRRGGRNLPARGRYWIRVGDRPRPGHRARPRPSRRRLADHRALRRRRGSGPPGAGRDARALQQPPDPVPSGRHRHLQPFPSLPGPGRGGRGRARVSPPVRLAVDPGGSTMPRTRVAYLIVAAVIVSAAAAGSAAAATGGSAVAASAAANGAAAGGQQAETPPLPAPDLYAGSPYLRELRNSLVYGEIWERPYLSKRDRSLITIAVLQALAREELAIHIPRGLDNGLTPEEISEIIPPCDLLFRVADRRAGLHNRRRGVRGARADARGPAARPGAGDRDHDAGRPQRRLRGGAAASARSGTACSTATSGSGRCSRSATAASSPWP